MSSTPSTLGEVVRTADGSLTLSHPEHGECYHSQSGAEAEARDLYVGASGIAGAWAGPVLDVGLGLGYNALLTLEAWMAAANPPPLTVTSLEIAPALVAALASGRAPWQATWSETRTSLCRRLAPAGPGLWRGDLPHPRAAVSAHWQVIVGDAQARPVPGGHAYIWQDPFSPARNPTMWSAAWFAKAGALALPGCRLLTYSVARGVRDALTAGGWRWEKIPAAHASKRHWLLATKADVACG